MFWDSSPNRTSPICSMHGTSCNIYQHLLICTNMYLINNPHRGKYTSTMEHIGVNQHSLTCGVDPLCFPHVVNELYPGSRCDNRQPHMKNLPAQRSTPGHWVNVFTDAGMNYSYHGSNHYSSTSQLVCKTSCYEL